MAVRATDVRLLLLSHCDRKGYTCLYMKAGTSNAPKYVPVHEIRRSLSIDLSRHTTCVPCHNWMCKIYGVADVDACNKARVKLLCIGRTQESLPSMLATFHSMRSHYQAIVWNSPYPGLPPVTKIGWMHLDGRLLPRLLSLSPITKACREITSCGCTKGCLSQRSSFWKLGDNCRNTRDDQE